MREELAIITWFKSKKRSPRLQKFFRWVFLLLLIASALWLGLFLWYQLGANSVWTWLALPTLTALVAAIIYKTIAYNTVVSNTLMSSKPNKSNSDKNGQDNIVKKLSFVYGLVLLASVATFFSLSPKDDRLWQAEVENILSYERNEDNPNIVTLHNVRNFTWHSNLPTSTIDGLKNDAHSSTAQPELQFSSNKTIKQYNQKAEDAIEPTEKWETRQVDLSKLTGVDVINSYWMGPQIGHTLVSFRFSDDRPITFSFEIRKEEGEEFSSLAGFFRKYELSLIAAEERDIVYTRSNWRGEQVYLLPLDNLTQAQVRELFEHYLQYADTLQTRPEWYNTFINNCTNLIFNMAREVDSERFPLDYRIWVTGYIPDYLYDNGLLPNSEPNETDHKNSEIWDMQTWYAHAYINPKTATLSEQDNQSMNAYSRLIRQDVPIPTLKDGKSNSNHN